MTTTPTSDLALLPADTVWEIDPGHAEVAFIGRHFMLTKVRGRFTDVTGEFRVGASMADASVDVRIGMASVESGNPARDEHIRSAELFDVEAHPTATFRSTAVEWSGDRGTVHGDLTIHGVTREVQLKAEVQGVDVDPWGNERVGLEVTGQINRGDFGMTFNQALGSGNLLVSDKVKLALDISAIKQAA